MSPLILITTSNVCYSSTFQVAGLQVVKLKISLMVKTISAFWKPRIWWFPIGSNYPKSHLYSSHGVYKISLTNLRNTETFTKLMDLNRFSRKVKLVKSHEVGVKIEIQERNYADHSWLLVSW